VEQEMINEDPVIVVGKGLMSLGEAKKLVHDGVIPPFNIKDRINLNVHTKLPDGFVIFL